MTGGPSTTVALGMGGAAWGADDGLILGGMTELRSISGLGEESISLTALAEGEVGHFRPELLPNGRAVLFYSTDGAGNGQIAVYDFVTGERTDLLTGSTPMFAATGHLVFWRAGSLWAVPFDPDRLVVEGSPVVVVEGVASFSVAEVGAYALADNGTLIYRPGATATTSTLGWVDRKGGMTAPLMEGRHSLPSLSPDGSQVAFRRQTENGGEDLWVRDLETGRDQRLTETGQVNRVPIWTPDGRAVTFASDRGHGVRLHERPVDLSSETTLIQSTPRITVPGAWTPDGRSLVYYMFSENGDTDIWSLTRGDDPVKLIATANNERAPRLSPDGHWLAYISDQTGDYRLYVEAFPAGGQVFPISIGQGREPVWSRDGRELFYRSGDKQVWAVDIETTPTFKAGTPRLLFEVPYALDPIGIGNPNYDVSLDGQQFLMAESTTAAEGTGFVVVQNWFEDLKRLVPIDE